MNADDFGVETTGKILFGKYKYVLPVVYISAPLTEAARFDEDFVSKFSFRLAGIAHVIVEPSREFSLKLMDETAGKNPYGGTIGICLPEVGVVSRLYLGAKFPSQKELLSAVEAKVIQLASSRSARIGWEWQDLLEETSRQLRARAAQGKGGGEAEEVALNEAISEKNDEISRLRKSVEELTERIAKIDDETGGSLLSSSVVPLIGRELYQGEFSDRIRSILVDVLRNDNHELDARTLNTLKLLLIARKFTGGARLLEQRFKSAGRNSGKADSLFEQILRELGYSVRKDGGHPVCTPPDDLFGLKSETLSTSPSDHRAGKNKAAQIINGMSLKKLS